MISLSRNFETLLEYNKLEAEEKSPVLAVYRGRSLWIVSYETEGVCQKLSSLVTRAAYAVLRVIGMIRYDEATINALREKVLDACCKVGGEKFTKEIESLKTVLHAKRFELEESHRGHKDLQHRVEELRKEFQELAPQTEESRTVIAQAEQSTREAAARRQELETTIVEFQKLEPQVKTLLQTKRTVLKNIEALKEERSVLQAQLQQLQGDTAQAKAAIAPELKELKSIIKTLEVTTRTCQAHLAKTLKKCKNITGLLQFIFNESQHAANTITIHAKAAEALYILNA